MEISQARPADLPAIQQMIRVLSAFHGDEARVRLAWLQEAFFGEADRATAFVAKDGDTYVGYAGVMHKISLHEGCDRFDVQHLFVTEGHRGTGVGRGLIRAACTFAVARGAKGMTIGADPSNTGAQAAYRAMGFEDITGTHPRFWITP